MKACSQCGKKKSHAEFQSMRSSRDGKRPECKSCTHKQDAERYRKNQDKRKAQKREWYRRYKERIMEQHREYRAANPEKIYRMYRNYRIRNAEKIAVWWKKSPRGRFLVLLKLALKRRPTVRPITVNELMEMWRDQGGKCAISGVDMTWHQGKTNPSSLSIDRINCKKGYERGNIRLVCYQVNVFRNRWSDEQMFEMAEAIIANMKKPKLRLVS